MIAKTPKSKTVSITKLRANPKENHRFHGSQNVLKGIDLKVDTYALKELELKIVEKGRIETPLVTVVSKDNPEELEVLQGFRRYFSALELWNYGQKGKLAGYLLKEFPELFFVRDKPRKDGSPGDLTSERNEVDPEDVAANVVKALEHIPVNVYDELTDQERAYIVADKGQEKRIRRAETIKAVWDMAGEGFTEKQIARAMTHQLADYTRNQGKVEEITKIKDPNERDRALTTWTHGTLGGFMLSVYGFNKRMRDNLLLTALMEDGLIATRKVVAEDGTESEELVMKPEFKLTHARWRNLMKAMKDDQTNKQWNATNLTGPAFEKLIEQYAKEDWLKIKPVRGADSRASKEVLQRIASQDFVDPVSKMVFDLAIEGKEAVGLKEKMSENLRLYGVKDVLLSVVDHISPKAQLNKAQLNDLLNGICRDDPVELQKVIAPYLTKEGQQRLSVPVPAPKETAKEAAK